MRIIILLISLLTVQSSIYGNAISTINTDENRDITTPKDTMSFSLNDIVITATRTPLMLKDTPVITRVVTGRSLEQRGVSTLQSALESELAGVEFHQAGYGSSMSFQGLDARYILFLVDGERMAGETYGNVDYARFPISNIERIEIVKGASSVLYGSNAMGAVVNIITRQPKNRVEVNAAFRYGTPFQKNSDEALGKTSSQEESNKYRRKLDMPNIKGDISVGLNLGKFRSLTNASLRSVDAYKLVGTQDEVRHYDQLQVFKIKPGPGGMAMVLDHIEKDVTRNVAPDSRGLSVSGWKDFNIAQKFDYEISRKFRIEVSGNYFNKNRYDFNSSVLDENPMPNPNKQWAFENFNGYNFKALMEHSPNENNKIYLSFARDDFRRSLDSLSGASTPKQHHVYNIPRLLWTLKAGKSHRLTSGIELINEQLQFDLNSVGGYSSTKSLNTTSAYIQDEIMSNRPLSFVVGVRADYNNRFGFRATPKASAKYNINNFSIRANYANGYRTPSLKEMYMEFTIPIPGQTSIIRGNPNLKAESNHYLSLSGEYNRSTVNLSATVYNSFFRNKIDVRGHREGAATILQYENINNSEFGGIELMAKVKVTKNFFLRANYNLILQEDDAPEESTQYIYPSPHSATFQADYIFSLWGANVSLNGIVKYTGPKNYEDFMAFTITEPGERIPTIYMGNYTSRHIGYATANLAMNVEFRNGLAVTIGVDNLLNYTPKIINFNSAITTPRNGFIVLSYAFLHR